MEFLIWILYIVVGLIALHFLIQFFTGVISNPLILIIAGIIYLIVTFSSDGII